MRLINFIWYLFSNSFSWYKTSYFIDCESFPKLKMKINLQMIHYQTASEWSVSKSVSNWFISNTLAIRFYSSLRSKQSPFSHELLWITYLTALYKFVDSIKHYISIVLSFVGSNEVGAFMVCVVSVRYDSFDVIGRYEHSRSLHSKCSS